MILNKSDTGSDIVRIGVLASGRGSNFQALCEGDTGRGRVALLLVDDPGAGALKRAEKLGVEAVHISPGKYRTRFEERAEMEWTRTMRDRGIQLICLAGLMRILKGPMLSAYGGRILNIHPSLLPSFPGLRAQEQALSYGVKVTGCTVHYVDAGVDTGPIVLQKTVKVRDDDDVGSLSERILRQEHAAYPEAVRLHCSGELRLMERRVLTGGGSEGRTD
ncbi:MAG: phosphoribosylglycinamide formyltransferase [Candidatus Aegiribacteria sp.]